MRIFGWDLSLRRKAAGTLSPVTDRGWWPLIRESYSGAWQNNDELTVDTQLAYYAVYSCVTLIANDIGKLRQKLMVKNGRIWSETTSPAFSPFLRKPNRYQNHIQFKEWWAMSKLTRGNTYALKERDNRGVVTAMHILDPSRVQVLVSPNGAVFYQLQQDNLSDLEGPITVPASEIAHDRMNCLFHPLVGVSPLFACGLAAAQGLSIQSQSRRFFSNGSRPSGILTAPGAISEENAQRVKEAWETKFSGENSGKVAVLGDDLKYQPLMMNSVDAQLIEQLKMTAEMVCAAYHVPAFKVGIGAMPTYQNGEMLNQIYYSDCLQSLIEQYEICQDEALSIGEGIKTASGQELGVELDLRGLLRMDTATQIKTLGDAVKGSLLTIDEAREEIDREAVDGGNVIWSQQQNWPISELAKRPAEALNPKPAAPAPEPTPEPEEDPEEVQERSARVISKALAELELELAA